MSFLMMFNSTACSGMYFLLCMYSLCWVLSTRRTYRFVHAVMVPWIFNWPTWTPFISFLIYVCHLSSTRWDFSPLPHPLNEEDDLKILMGFLYWQKNFGLGLKILSSTGWLMRTGNHDLNLYRKWWMITSFNQN